METHDVPRREWHSFTDAFTRRHQGAIARIEVVGGEIGAQVEVDGLPFEGITFDERGSAGAAVSIMAGNRGHDHITHTITSPLSIRVEADDEGVEEVVQIESAAGETTLLQLVRA